MANLKLSLLLVAFTLGYFARGADSYSAHDHEDHMHHMGHMHHMEMASEKKSGMNDFPDWPPFTFPPLPPIIPKHGSRVPPGLDWKSLADMIVGVVLELLCSDKHVE